ncbi:MAG: hydroxyacid dehydrogenase [Planctomycetota bacterium]|nr:MAG: hydroxyacid dehydrogenase [Planctomycetota bacterium]
MPPIVGITHSHRKAGKFFTDEALAALAEHAELRFLGNAKEPGFHQQLSDVDILIGSWGMPQLNADFLAAAPQLRAVCYAAGTVKGFVTDASYARGIVVTTAMHANAIPVAEVSVALILLANKRWFVCQDAMRRDGEMGRQSCYGDGHPGNYRSTVGLIGYGAIGRATHALLQAYDLQVLIYDPYANADEIAAQGAEAVELVELARRSDVVSLHAPNIPATRHMMNREVFAAMRDGATFINTARGALVDEDALVAELRTGRIYAMLDVTDPEPPAPDHPFWTLPNCWLTPHRAGSSGREVQRMGAYAVEDCLRILRGEAPRYPVTQDMLATMA